MASFHGKKTAAEKSYVAALCKILVLLQFRVSEQGAIKLMQRILGRMSTAVASEKDLMKELKHMAERLKAIDRNPDDQLSPEQTTLILGNEKNFPYWTTLVLIFWCCIGSWSFLYCFVVSHDLNVNRKVWTNTQLGEG